jgi:hypothetical protein
MKKGPLVRKGQCQAPEQVHLSHMKIQVGIQGYKYPIITLLFEWVTLRSSRRESDLPTCHPHDYLSDKWVLHPSDKDKEGIRNQRKIPKINPKCRNKNIPKQHGRCCVQSQYFDTDKQIKK